MHDLKFSIVVPVQNGAATIERLFGSLLIQKHAIHEIIVCNDNSTDNTLDLVNKYTNILPIRIFTVPENLQNNPGRARQVGLDNVSGDWVVFADADDVLTFNAIECYEKIIQTNQNEKMVCCAFDEITFSPFQLINHLQQPLAWVHAKAFNYKYIADNNLRFHDKLFTHEDKYFVFLNIFDMRIKGIFPLVADATTYYWCRGDNTIVTRDNGKYPVLSLVESMDAMIDSCDVVAKNNHLTLPDINKFFHDELLVTAFDCYNKMQGSAFAWGKQILDTYNIYSEVPNRIAKIRELTGWSNTDINDMLRTNIELFENSRLDTIRTIGQFTPFQTFDEFLQSVS